MENFFLIGASFLTSTLTATIGTGGGVVLIALMPGLIPAAAIVPVHGAVQLASNSSRVLLGVSHIDWRVVWPFVGGAVAGAVAGAGMVARMSFDHLPLYLGKVPPISPGSSLRPPPRNVDVFDRGSRYTFPVLEALDGAGAIRPRIGRR